jgi:hypothetical protein
LARINANETTSKGPFIYYVRVVVQKMEFFFLLYVIKMSLCRECVSTGAAGSCSGCTNLQIFGMSPFAPADFEAFSTKCNH